VKILALRPDKRPHRLVILLDTSGSMRGELGGQEWKIASTVAAHIGQSDLKNTSFALLLFSDSVREQIYFSQGNPAVASRLLDIWSDTTYAKKSVRGRTALLDAILSALRLLGDSGYSESVYVISDGGDNLSRSHLNDVRKALAAAQVRLHVTLLAPDSRISPLESMGATDLMELASESGGLIVGPLGLAPSGSVSYDLAEVERRAIATQLSLLYLGMTNNDLVDIELPQAVDKWRKWTLELSPASKKLYKDLWVTYPQELAPCSALPH
jgi:von Willebrand factor type A domain